MFEARFGDPREGSSERFVWDWWHVPGQYTLLRTPAYAYFPRALYEQFHRHLVTWGREHLGCHDVSPPWLSCYIEGCKQEIHADVPHGPWAFVYSLTPWKARTFEGGETLLLKPEILSFWRGLDQGRGLELDDVFLRLPSPFNRLTVFDPRLPHGVSEVRGTRDPREGRLVIHGWFVQPRPFVVGGLAPGACAPVLEEVLRASEPRLAALGELKGALSLRLRVSAAGRVTRVETLTNNLMPPSGEPGVARRARNILVRAFEGARFPGARGPTAITLPVLFG